MMVERLTIFQKQSRCLPDRVFVYRDGVSEVRRLNKFAM
jgi:eukaryotic translation initiation factor 2C